MSDPIELAIEAMLDVDHPVKRATAEWAAAHVSRHDMVAADCESTFAHGAIGYVTEHEVERDLRDAGGGLIYSGTSDIQRNIIARLLGVG